MIRGLLTAAAAAAVAVLAVGPVTDRMARRIMAAPRRAPGEGALAGAIDALGGEVVRLRSRDGVRLAGRWLPADPGEAGTGNDDAWSPDPSEAILLLHGYTGSIAPDLVEYAPFLRRTANVLGLDFRGHGGSDDGPTTFGLLEVDDVAGALAWLGERGITRVALVGSSMGGITAIAAVAVLGDGRLASADQGAHAPAAPVDVPRPRIVAVVGDSVTPELSIVVASRTRFLFARPLLERAFARFARVVGGDPRATQPIAVVGLLEDVPLLLVHGQADRTLPIRDGLRLAAAAPDGTAHLVVPGADHGAGHGAAPAAYEAAVTEHLRRAFERARPPT